MISFAFNVKRIVNSFLVAWAAFHVKGSIVDSSILKMSTTTVILIEVEQLQLHLEVENFVIVIQLIKDKNFSFVCIEICQRTLEQTHNEQTVSTHFRLSKPISPLPPAEPAHTCGQFIFAFLQNSSDTLWTALLCFL